MFQFCILGNRLFPYGREAMNVALRQLTDQYAVQPMIRYNGGSYNFLFIYR